MNCGWEWPDGRGTASLRSTGVGQSRAEEQSGKDDQIALAPNQDQRQGDPDDSKGAIDGVGKVELVLGEATHGQRDQRSRDENQRPAIVDLNPLTLSTGLVALDTSSRETASNAVIAITATTATDQRLLRSSR